MLPLIGTLLFLISKILLYQHFSSWLYTYSSLGCVHSEEKLDTVNYANSFVGEVCDWGSLGEVVTNVTNEDQVILFYCKNTLYTLTSCLLLVWSSLVRFPNSLGCSTQEGRGTWLGLHWFPIDFLNHSVQMVRNGPKLCKHKGVLVNFFNSVRYPGFPTWVFQKWFPRRCSSVHS